MTNTMPKPLFHGSAFSTTVDFVISKRDTDRQIDSDERWLGRFVLPNFQRPQVWTAEQKVKLIESIWLGLPIASFVYNQPDYTFDHPTDQWLIDGQQRITAIQEYVADEFEVFGSVYSDIDDRDRRRFQMSGFPCIQLNTTDRSFLEDVYYRLAYGGTPHD